MMMCRHVSHTLVMCRLYDVDDDDRQNTVKLNSLEIKEETLHSIDTPAMHVT